MRGLVRAVLPMLVAASVILPAGPVIADTSIPPAVGDCTNDPTMESWSHVGTTVDCSLPHTGQTLVVSTWTASLTPTQADGLAVGGPEDLALRQGFQPQFDACEKAMTNLVGGVRTGYQIPSEFTTNFVGPSAAEWAEGQRWARCDIVASAPLTMEDIWTVKELPAPAALVGIMDTPLKTNGYRLCYWDRKQGYGLIDCASPYVTYDLPAAYSGADLTWPGSALGLLLKVRAKCRANPSVRSFGAKTSAIHASVTQVAKLTKANYRDQTYDCMIKR